MFESVRGQTMARLMSLSRCAGGVGCLLALASPAPAPAQCDGSWISQSAVPGVSGAFGSVNRSTMWDPDGNGPLPAKLVIGGNFLTAGTVLANAIAAFDPATGQWSA